MTFERSVEKFWRLWKISKLRKTQNAERVDVELDNTISVEDWKEGVEELRKLSKDHLWQMLGLLDNCLPFFQEWMDPDVMIDPWSEEGQVFLQNSDSGRKPLIP